MAEIIACPRCERKLRMDESVIGQAVQCPSCQHTFTATAPAPSAAPPPRRVEEDAPVYRPIDDEPPPRPRYEEPRPRRRYADDDDDYPRPRRNRFRDDYLKPHRGMAVLVLGILSLVLFFSLPGLIMAIVATVMGTSDLAAMNRGEMMDSGRGQTKAGLICALVTFAIEVLALFTCCGLGVFNN